MNPSARACSTVYRCSGGSLPWGTACSRIWSTESCGWRTGHTSRSHNLSRCHSSGCTSFWLVGWVVHLFSFLVWYERDDMQWTEPPLAHRLLVRIVRPEHDVPMARMPSPFHYGPHHSPLTADLSRAMNSGTVSATMSGPTRVRFSFPGCFFSLRHATAVGLSLAAMMALFTSV